MKTQPQSINDDHNVLVAAAHIKNLHYGLAQRRSTLLIHLYLNQKVRLHTNYGLGLDFHQLSDLAIQYVHMHILAIQTRSITSCRLDFLEIKCVASSYIRNVHLIKYEQFMIRSRETRKSPGTFINRLNKDRYTWC